MNSYFRTMIVWTVPGNRGACSVIAKSRREQLAATYEALKAGADCIEFFPA